MQTGTRLCHVVPGRAERAFSPLNAKRVPVKFISCYHVVIVLRRLVGREQVHAGAAVDDEHGQSRAETFWLPGWGCS